MVYRRCQDLGVSSFYSRLTSSRQRRFKSSFPEVEKPSEERGWLDQNVIPRAFQADMDLVLDTFVFGRTGSSLVLDSGQVRLSAEADKTPNCGTREVSYALAKGLDNENLQGCEVTKSRSPGNEIN
jgi:hypothetical protein